MSATQPINKVVLIGAGGNLGAIILAALLNAKAFQVTIVTRESSSASFSPDLRVVRTAYTENKLVKAFAGHDAVISAVGATGFLDQKVIIDATVKAGVKRFIPSEFSSNTRSEAVRHLVPVFEPKKMVLDYLKAKEASGLSWTGLATGILFDWAFQVGFLGFDLVNKKAEIWDDGNVAFSATTQDDFGKAIIGILTHPAETANQYLYVSSVTSTQRAILEVVQSHTGQEWTVQHVKTDEEIARGRELVAKGDFSGMFALVKASAWGTVPGIRTNYPVDENLANELIGLRAESSIDEVMRNVLRSVA
ncbi:NmrA-like family protein [Exophiala viscosa]|uniref:NmrA-like family protein n=1 Tax=Exophiala viscosa TaxID=2486360 RepID=A0AAN6E143_9EURO|nr:NmrA-like family protein [Exophiala viscosa]